MQKINTILPKPVEIYSQKVESNSSNSTVVQKRCINTVQAWLTIDQRTWALKILLSRMSFTQSVRISAVKNVSMRITGEIRLLLRYGQAIGWGRVVEVGEVQLAWSEHFISPVRGRPNMISDQERAE